jgi:hypothetical protein
MIDTTMGSPQMATMPVSRRPVADPIGGQSEMSPFRLVLGRARRLWQDEPLPVVDEGHDEEMRLDVAVLAIVTMWPGYGRLDTPLLISSEGKPLMAEQVGDALSGQQLDAVKLSGAAMQMPAPEGPAEASKLALSTPAESAGAPGLERTPTDPRGPLSRPAFGGPQISPESFFGRTRPVVEEAQHGAQRGSTEPVPGGAPVLPQQRYVVTEASAPAQRPAPREPAEAPKLALPSTPMGYTAAPESVQSQTDLQGVLGQPAHDGTQAFSEPLQVAQTPQVTDRLPVAEEAQREASPEPLHSAERRTVVEEAQHGARLRSTEPVPGGESELPQQLDIATEVDGLLQRLVLGRVAEADATLTLEPRPPAEAEVALTLEPRRLAEAADTAPLSTSGRPVEAPKLTSMPTLPTPVALAEAPQVVRTRLDLSGASSQPALGGTRVSPESLQSGGTRLVEEETQREAPLELLHSVQRRTVIEEAQHRPWPGSTEPAPGGESELPQQPSVASVPSAPMQRLAPGRSAEAAESALLSTPRGPTKASELTPVPAPSGSGEVPEPAHAAAEAQRPVSQPTSGRTAWLSVVPSQAEPAVAMERMLIEETEPDTPGLLRPKDGPARRQPMDWGQQVPAGAVADPPQEAQLILSAEAVHIQEDGPPQQWGVLAEHVRAAVTQEGSAAMVRLCVEPEALGEVHVEVVLDEDQRLSARFLTASAGAKRLLEAGLPHLRHRLQAEGLALCEVSFRVIADSEGVPATPGLLTGFQAGAQGGGEKTGQGWSSYMASSAAVVSRPARSEQKATSRRVAPLYQIGDSTRVDIRV